MIFKEKIHTILSKTQIGIHIGMIQKKLCNQISFQIRNAKGQF